MRLVLFFLILSAPLKIFAQDISLPTELRKPQHLRFLPTAQSQAIPVTLSPFVYQKQDSQEFSLPPGDPLPISSFFGSTEPVPERKNPFWREKRKNSPSIAKSNEETTPLPAKIIGQEESRDFDAEQPLTEEEKKKVLRRQRNRESARRSRLKGKKQIETLLEKTSDLENRISVLERIMLRTSSTAPLPSSGRQKKQKPLTDDSF